MPYGKENEEITYSNVDSAAERVREKVEFSSLISMTCKLLTSLQPHVGCSILPKISHDAVRSMPISKLSSQVQQGSTCQCLAQGHFSRESVLI